MFLDCMLFLAASWSVPSELIVQVMIPFGHVDVELSSSHSAHWHMVEASKAPHSSSKLVLLLLMNTWAINWSMAAVLGRVLNW